MQEYVKAKYLFRKLSKQEIIAKVKELLYINNFQYFKIVYSYTTLVPS